VFALVVAGLLVTSSLMSSANDVFQGQAPVSRAESLKLVKDDLARRLKIDAMEIEVAAQSDETWSDSTLGCSARKPLEEPISTPGFAFTLSHRGRSYVYHTDRRGHFRRCETAKPVAPVVR
jgi:hypothetical protein